MDVSSIDKSSILHILRYLGVTDLLRFQQTCQAVCDVSSSPVLWEELLWQEFGLVVKVNSSHVPGWAPLPSWACWSPERGCSIAQHPCKLDVDSYAFVVMYERCH